jgi:(p)ppGpp synthase/HD superfamily hydrolase
LPDRAAIEPAPGLARSALAFAVRCHAGRRRESDGAPFIAHSLEVARLLRDAGCSELVVAAGLLHDVVQDAGVSVGDLTSRFGAAVASLVDAVSDHGCVESYRPRKLGLREQVRSAGGDAALLFAADEISNVGELAAQVRRDQNRFCSTATEQRARIHLEHYQRMRVEHCRESLGMLRGVAPGHALVERLASDLDSCPITSAG